MKETIQDPATAYPLVWPWWWPRKTSFQRKHSAYRVTFTTAKEELQRALRNAGAKAVVLSTNLPLQRNGDPYATYREPADPGVALYWTDRKGIGRVIPCDSWKTARENLRAVGLAFEATQLFYRTGCAELEDRALDVFKALPPAPRTGPPWTEVLGLKKPIARAAIHDRFRKLASTMHPDRGGDPEAFSIVSAAYTEALKEIPK